MSSIEMIDVLNRLRELDKKNPNVVNDAVDNTERMNGSVNEAPLTRQQAAAMQSKANAAFGKLDREVANQKARDNNLDANGMPTPNHPDYKAFQAWLASRNKGAKTAPTAKPQATAKGPYAGWVQDVTDDVIISVGPDRFKYKDGQTGKVHTAVASPKYPLNANGYNYTSPEEYIKATFKPPTGESIEEAKKAKPDFLDVDKDGNKKEPMKKALKDKEKVKEGVTISCDTPEEASAIARMMQLAGLQQVTPDMMPGQDNVPVVKPEASCGCGDTPEYENAPEEQYSDVAAVTTDAGLDGVNGKKAPQDIRVKDPSPHEDFEVGRLKDLAGIESEEEVEEEWDNEPDEHYKEYDADEYADKDGHATAKTRQVPAKSGDNPLESIEHNLLQAYEEFLAKEETN